MAIKVQEHLTELGTSCYQMLYEMLIRNTLCLGFLPVCIFRNIIKLSVLAIKMCRGPCRLSLHYLYSKPKFTNLRSFCDETLATNAYIKSKSTLHKGFISPSP